MSYHKSIFRNLPFPCLLFEKKKNLYVIKEANSLYCKVTDKSEKELIGKTVEEVFPDNPTFSGLKDILDSFNNAYTSKESHRIDVLRYDLYDNQNITYDLKYWEVENIPVFDEVENTWYILNIVKDITTQIIEKDRGDLLQVKLDAKTEKHKKFIERNTDGIYTLDQDGYFVSLNQGLIDITETPEEKLIKMNFLPFCDPEHRDRIVERFNNALKGENQKFEAKFVSGRGREMVLDISLIPFRSNGIITGVYGIAKDVTKLKESEVALLESERKFKALVQEGSDLIGILDLEGKYKFVSETSYSVLGITPEEFIGKTAFDFIHPEDKERVITNFSELETKNQVAIAPFRYRNAKGEWRWFETKATNLIDDPVIAGIVTNSHDITDRILSEKALKENEEKYRAFFESSLDGILLTNPYGEIFAANNAACKLFQRTEQEICEIGRNGLVDLNDPRVEEAIRERERTGKVNAELNMRRKDGSIFSAALSSAIFEGAKSEKLTSMIIRDNSESKRAEEELKASEKEYRKLFQNSPLPNIIYDKDTLKILDVNKATSENYGFSRDDLLNASLLDFIPTEEITDIKKNIFTLPFKEGEVAHHRNITLEKNGRRIIVETFGYGMQYQHKNCRLVILLDVTEKEIALQKLKDKTEKLITAQKIAKMGYWTHNLENNKFFWSDEVFNIWGRDQEIFQPSVSTFRDTIHPEDLENFIEANKLALNGKELLDFEHRIILPDGKIKWVHERGKLIKNREGKATFEGTVQDVTERRNSLEKLMQSEARQRGILHSQTNYLTRINLQGNYTYVNDKFVIDFKWLYKTEKIEQQSALSSVKPYHHDRVRETFKKCVANPNTIFQLEIDKYKEDGGQRTTLWDFICIPDTKGNPFEVQGVGIDITDRIKAQRELKESNTRYELVSKATSDAIYDWDINANFLIWGKAFYAIFGYSQDEFQPTIEAYLEKIHPDEKDQITKSLTRVIEGKDNRWKEEYRFKKADGTYATVIEKGFILRDKNGMAYRMVGAMQDITERKKLEALLDEATKLAQIGSFEIDCEKEALYWSAVTKEIHGVPLDYKPTLEKGIYFYKEGESRTAMNNAYRRAYKDNIPYDLELQLITAKGEERWVRKIGRPTFVNGKCVRINGSFQDITNLKMSEMQALKASEEKEKILESIGDAFWMVDNDWTVTYWNKHAEKVLNCPRKQIIGRNLWEVFSDALGTMFETHYFKAVEEQTIENFEAYFKRVNKWLEVTAYPSQNGLSVYFRDITERKEAELQIRELNKNLKIYTEELVEANKGLEQFSFIVSHNLRSPVANIIGLSDLINQEDYPKEVQNKFLQSLFDNVKRLDTVISDLNTILQVKVEMDAKKEPVILNNLVADIRSSIQNLIEKEKVQIKTNFEVSTLNTVQSYLHSIFYNLISNSIKYRQTNIPPQIKISSKIKDGTIVIAFEDNGLGIDLEKKGDQVFGLYRKFHNHVEGKGMGLFLVKTQVELLGGKISIESKVNGGTKFIITFKEKTYNYISEYV
ncbi:PAS domain S-box protein [Salegentibacter sp. UBA1130]|uniref:PAS domain S-box protein n=1 Tax=Salegentibacter sp. UBA1130 TaxID=1947451 RepID=UPI00258085F0|nr:PAS domain S-box protein [Salegentibacter sp. UBA1130]